MTQTVPPCTLQSLSMTSESLSNDGSSTMVDLVRNAKDSGSNSRSAVDKSPAVVVSHTEIVKDPVGVTPAPHLSQVAPMISSASSSSQSSTFEYSDMRTNPTEAGAPDDAPESTSVQTLSIFESVDREDWPVWLELAFETLMGYKPLRDVDLWSMILVDWVELERKYEFDNPSGPGAFYSRVGCPELVDWWSRVAQKKVRTSPPPDMPAA
ncbi:hypothetical protein VKT23_020002 [Stygiomarasmius scandens]|uniref:Uncharacterized protein n=1 Tax=Marasmiellus scandens TaxID=2682957 RepID=A0ABR1INQ9_9AGAR